VAKCGQVRKHFSCGICSASTFGSADIGNHLSSTCVVLEAELGELVAIEVVVSLRRCKTVIEIVGARRSASRALIGVHSTQISVKSLAIGADFSLECCIGADSVLVEIAPAEFAKTSASVETSIVRKLMHGTANSLEFKDIASAAEFLFVSIADGINHFLATCKGRSLGGIDRSGRSGRGGRSKTLVHDFASEMIS
jgi:hypothetical protein